MPSLWDEKPRSVGRHRVKLQRGTGMPLDIVMVNELRFVCYDRRFYSPGLNVSHGAVVSRD